ncbi:hypothetical protein ZWY2020_056857 [Hordeum vulgare]|nr:hypothetical protein ZWY2020_056857 [Hordeum vulgare]
MPAWLTWQRGSSEMEGKYGVSRELKHYGCMADLLGRAGLIEEAIKMAEKMSMKGDTYVWGGILAGCRMHGNVEAAEVAARHLLELNPEDGGYTLSWLDLCRCWQVGGCCQG